MPNYGNSASNQKPYVNEFHAMLGGDKLVPKLSALYDQYIKEHPNMNRAARTWIQEVAARHVADSVSAKPQALRLDIECDSYQQVREKMEGRTTKVSPLSSRNRPSSDGGRGAA